jgi:hypothetical protein
MNELIYKLELLEALPDTREGMSTVWLLNREHKWGLQLAWVTHVQPLAKFKMDLQILMGNFQLEFVEII